jgi:hypothetical protein
MSSALGNLGSVLGEALSVELRHRWERNRGAEQEGLGAALGTRWKLGRELGELHRRPRFSSVRSWVH